MSAKNCKEYKVYLSGHCEKEYRRASKKMDRNLRGEIASELQRLRTDPRRGAELAHNLAGRRSIHIAKFSYRMVYRVDDNSCTITVESISRRKSVYNNLKRRHGA